MIKYIKNMRSLTKFIIFSFAIILIYTAIELITPDSHDTLTTCVYACFGGEVMACALIKVFKLRENDTKSDDYPDGVPLTKEEIHDLMDGFEIGPVKG